MVEGASSSGAAGMTRARPGRALALCSGTGAGAGARTAELATSGATTEGVGASGTASFVGSTTGRAGTLGSVGSVGGATSGPRADDDVLGEVSTASGPEMESAPAPATVTRAATMRALSPSPLVAIAALPAAALALPALAATPAALVAASATPTPFRTRLRSASLGDTSPSEVASDKKS